MADAPFDPTPPPVPPDGSAFSNPIWQRWFSGLYSKLTQVHAATSAAMSSLSANLDSAQASIDSANGQLVTVNGTLNTVQLNINSLFSTTDSQGNSIAQNSADIISGQQALATQSESTTIQINAMRTTIGGDISSAVASEAATRSDADSSLAVQINAVQSQAGDNLASVQQTLQTSIDLNASNLSTTNTNLSATNDKVAAIGALYSVQLNANGLVGGFYLYNNAQTVACNFDVDSFAIGRTAADVVKPFYFSNGTTYMSSAVIQQLEVEKIQSGSVGAEWRMTGANGRVVMDNGTVMKVIGTGFGANSDLIEWFGPSMAIASCTKANATSYEAIDGSAYFGGSLSAGTLYNAQQTTQIAANASVPLGPFHSNGNPRTIVVSLSFDWFMASSASNSGTFVADSTPTYADVQLLKGSTVLQTTRFTGSYTIENGTSGDPGNAEVQISGSFTVTDTGPAGDYTYTAQITARSLVNITNSTGTVVTNTTKQTLSIRSTEQ